MNASLQSDGEINIEFPTTNELSSKDDKPKKRNLGDEKIST